MPREQKEDRTPHVLHARQQGADLDRARARVLRGRAPDHSIGVPPRGAFYTLGQARPGQTIDVTRADHLIATFTIDSVEQTPKTRFPFDKVYAAVPYAALRLITCGGQFDHAKHSYLDNTIVYAHLTSVRRA